MYVPADLELGRAADLLDREARRDQAGDLFQGAAGDLRSDVSAEDIAASLIGIFTVAPPARSWSQSRSAAGPPDGRPQARRPAGLSPDRGG